MKTLIIYTLFALFLPADLLPQPIHHYMIDPHLLTQPVRLNVVRANQLSAETTAAVSNFRLRPGELKAVATVGTQPTKINVIPPSILREISPNAKLFVLPEVYYSMEQGTGNQLSYQILYVDKAPMRLDFMRKTFLGLIRFYAIEPNYLNDPHPIGKQLAAPEEIYVTFKEGRIPLSINQINFPPYDVPILYPNPLDSLEVKVLTPGKPEGYPAFLPVEPAILLSGSRNTIQGLGLQTMPISVSLVGVTSYRPISVNVMSSLGTIDSSHLTLTSDSPKEVILRSESLGKIDVNIARSNYPSNIVTVEAVFPWLFLILAVAGGLLGGIGKKLKGRGKITLKVIAYSCFVGLLAAVVYWGLGIKLIEFAFEDRGYNESMVFALGLIAGYFGIAEKKSKG